MQAWDASPGGAGRHRVDVAGTIRATKVGPLPGQVEYRARHAPDVALLLAGMRLAVTGVQRPRHADSTPNPSGFQ